MEINWGKNKERKYWWGKLFLHFKWLFFLPAIILGEIPRSLDLYVYLDSFQLTYKNKKHMITGFSNCYFQVNKPRTLPQINFIKNYLHLKPSFKVICARYQKPQSPEREKWRGAGYVTAEQAPKEGSVRPVHNPYGHTTLPLGHPFYRSRPYIQEYRKSRGQGTHYLISGRRFPTFTVTQTTSKKVNNYPKPPLQSCWA